MSGAVSITITEQRAPACRAASATPCAALPALTVQTPSFRLFRRELPDDVVGAADLERSDRLQHFELQIQFLGPSRRSGEIPQIETEEGCAHRCPIDCGRGVADGGKRDMPAAKGGRQDDSNRSRVRGRASIHSCPAKWVARLCSRRVRERSGVSGDRRVARRPRGTSSAGGRRQRPCSNSCESRYSKMQPG